MHVHMNYGGAYVNDPARLRAQAEAEDLHVVEDLIVNKEQRIPDIARFSPDLDPVSTATTLVKHDEEYHTSWWGHTGHLGLKEHLILPIYAGYANTPAWSLFPDNSTIIDLAHAQGGISGYVHPLDPPAPDPAGADPLTYALPVDVALGKADYIEVVGFSDHQTTAGVWYRLLNAGFRLPTGSGTDAMANYASLRGPVGMNRVFARSGAKLDYRAWLGRDQGGEDVRDERAAPVVHARRSRSRRRDRAAGGRPRARREGEPALDRSGREARDRLERPRRRDRAARGRRDARGRDDLAAGDEERLVHAARLVAERRRAGARHLSLRDHEPDLRDRRWRPDPQRRPTRGTSSRGSSASRPRHRPTAAGTTRRRSRRCSSASPPRRRFSRSGRTKRPGRPADRIPARLHVTFVRHPPRSIRDPVAPRCGRNGGGLPRARLEARPRGRHQGPAGALRRGSGAAGAISARGPGPRLAQSSEHRTHSRARGVRRRPGARAGAGRGRDAGRADRGAGRFPSTRRSASRARSRPRWRPRTRRGSSTAT